MKRPHECDKESTSEFQFKKPMHPDKDLYVYLDFTIGEVRVGRVAIKLFNKIVPRTCENFRALCTGEKGSSETNKPLHYKNTFIHKVEAELFIQGGDIVNFDGTGGESIYGETFTDEGFSIKHEVAGIVTMANFGTPNSNNSQFAITAKACPQMDDTHVAFGMVVNGLGIVTEISKLPRDDNYVPVVECKITDCGELDPNEDWCLGDNDETDDKYPAYPEDYECHPLNTNSETIEHILNTIKMSGNHFFDAKNYPVADYKYTKLLRYIGWASMQMIDGEIVIDGEVLMNLSAVAKLNLASVKLKRKMLKETVELCDQVISLEPDNCKAYYRKAQAYEALNEFELSLEEIKKAAILLPNDTGIANKVAIIDRKLRCFKRDEQQTCQRMFRS